MSKNNHGIFKVLLLFSVIVALSFISFTNASAAIYEPAKKPKIKSFTASKTEIKPGDTVTLSWEVVNATDIQISESDKTDEKDLPLTGSIEVTPVATTTYVLTATGKGGTTSASVTITVTVNGNTDKNVAIDSFYASDSEIELGQTTTLYWKTTNAKAVSIIGLEKQDEEDEPLPLSGNLEVFPTDTTTYILVAVGNNYQIVHKILTVKVTKSSPAKINYFSASAARINKGESVTLSWYVTDASYVKISGIDDKLPLCGFLDVAPEKTTTYVLEARGLDGVTVTKAVTVTVSEIKESPLTLTYKVHDWGDEYIIDFDITNESSVTVNDWTLKLKKSEFDISIIWGATFTENSEYILISPLYYNNVIKPGITVSFGFQAYGSPEPDFYYEFETK